MRSSLLLIAVLAAVFCCSSAHFMSGKAFQQFTINAARKVENDVDYSIFGCKPVINNATSVSALSALQVSVAVVMDYGNCNPDYTKQGYGFYRSVSWGDGTRNRDNVPSILPFQVLHTYHNAGPYTVQVKYCSRPPLPKIIRCAVKYYEVTVA